MPSKCQTACCASVQKARRSHAAAYFIAEGNSRSFIYLVLQSGQHMFRMETAIPFKMSDSARCASVQKDDLILLRVLSEKEFLKLYKRDR